MMKSRNKGEEKIQKKRITSQGAAEHALVQVRRTMRVFCTVTSLIQCCAFFPQTASQEEGIIHLQSQGLLKSVLFKENLVKFHTSALASLVHTVLPLHLQHLTIHITTLGFDCMANAPGKHLIWEVWRKNILVPSHSST